MGCRFGNIALGFRAFHSKFIGFRDFAFIKSVLLAGLFGLLKNDIKITLRLRMKLMILLWIIISGLVFCIQIFVWYPSPKLPFYIFWEILSTGNSLDKPRSIIHQEHQKSKKPMWKLQSKSVVSLKNLQPALWSEVFCVIKCVYHDQTAKLRLPYFTILDLLFNDNTSLLQEQKDIQRYFEKQHA